MPDPRRAVAIGLLSLLVAIEASDRTVDARSDGDVGPLGRLAGTLRDRLLDVVGPDEIVERLDVNAVLARVDIDEVLERVDVNALLDRVDVDRLLAHVDVDALFARVEVNALLDRVDVDRLVDRVEPDRLVARVDVDGLMDRVDVERLVQRAGIPEIVAESTGNVVESALDLLRRQLLALDVVLTRGVMRLRGHDDARVPAGPRNLVGDGGADHALPTPDAPITDVTGHYAGPVTRLTAHLLDASIATSAFTVASGALTSLLRATALPVDDTRGLLFAGGLALWLLVYWFASTAVAGRTPGMAVIGLRIVDREGDPLTGRRALRRVLVLPFSIVSVVGLIGIVVDRERRGLHDLAAGSTVVYDWGDRSATLPTPLARWLARHAAPVEPAPRRHGARP